MMSTPTTARLPRASLCLVLCSGALALGCDASTHGRDASSPLSSGRVAQVSVRIDAPGGGAPSVSVLAFRATTTGLPSGEVLGTVDPLVAPAPEGRCELRDVDGAARALRAQGGAVDLEEFENVQVALGPSGERLRPVPRVYPQLAAVVGGVIGEAGPFDVQRLPATISFLLANTDGVALPTSEIFVPALPRVLDQDGRPLVTGARLEASDDLVIGVSGPARSFVEIRPFGAPLAIACPAGPGGRVTVARELLDRLRAASGRVPVSFEAVSRESRLVATGSSQPIQISLELRSSAVLDLRP